MKTINEIIRKHTAFNGALDLVKSSRHLYRPSLNTMAHEDAKDRKLAKEAAKQRRIELTAIADFYDAMMVRRGIDKVAYRF